MPTRVRCVRPGHESTAISLTWVLYLLAKHPDVQRKVVDEIDGVMGSGPLTMVKLSMLTYQSQVIREALRLYPPVHVAERRAPRDIEFGDMLVPRNVRARARARTRTHARTRERMHARTHPRTHTRTHVPTHPRTHAHARHASR